MENNQKEVKSLKKQVKNLNTTVIIIIIVVVIILIIMFIVFIHRSNNNDNYNTNFFVTKPQDGDAPGSYKYDLNNDSAVIVIDETFLGSSIPINYLGNLDTTGYMYIFKNTTANTIMLTPGTNVIFSNGNTKLQTANCNTVLTYNDPNIPIDSIPLAGGGLIKLVLMNFTGENDKSVTLLQL